MTEYKILLFYDVPMPEFFRASMEEFLKRAVEQGILSGYEFQSRDVKEGERVVKTAVKEAKKIKKEHEKELQSAGKKVEKPTPGPDTGTVKRDEDRNDQGEAGGSVGINKTVRSDTPNNSKT